MAPALGASDRFVAVFVPTIPSILGRGIGRLVLSVGARAADRDCLAFVDARAAFRRREVRFTLSDSHHSLAGGAHLNTEFPFSTRVNGDVGGINFSVGFRALEDRVEHQPLSHLNLDARSVQAGDVGLGLIGKAQDVSVVKLHFRARARARGDLVSRHDGRVQRRCHPVTRIAALRRNVSVDQADPADALLSLILRCGWRRGRRRGLAVCLPGAKHRQKCNSADS